MSANAGYNPRMNYYASVNDDIRATLLAALKAENITQADLARRLNLPRQNINRALKGTDPQGKTPHIWERMLAELGYKLVIVKDDA